MKQMFTAKRVLVHVACLHLAVSIVNASYAFNSQNNTESSKMTISQKDATDTQQKILSSIKDMYSGNGADSGTFNRDVTFRDPVVICQGIDEVREAFRALKVMSPKIVEEPKLFVGSDNKELLIELKTSYICIKPFTVNSICVIKTDEDGNIETIEERWNFVPLIDRPLFKWSKRLNGLISYGLTRSLI